MQHKKVGFALSVIAIACMGSAQANVSLSASLSDFGYTLVDLNPADGIAPSVSFENKKYYLAGLIREGSTPPGNTLPYGSSFIKSGLFDENRSVMKSVEGPNSKAMAGVVGSFSNHSFAAFVSGQALNGKTDPLLASMFELEGNPAIQLVMSLAPFTRIVWTGNLSLAGEETLGRRGARVEAGSIQADVQIHGDDGANFDFVSGVVSLDVGIIDRKSKSLDVNLSFSNSSTDSMTAVLATTFAARGISFLPVPEPSTPLLMLSGIGIMASLVRVKRRLAA
jgi:hypothetical protein